MKAGELRIGNLVYWKRISLDGGQKEVATIQNGGFISAHATNDAFDPIPLTEEWLLKIDMPEDGSTKDLFGSYDVWFERVGNELYLKTETSSKKIEFVHIAQNIAFYLTGEELGVNK